MGSVLFLEPGTSQESTQFVVHNEFNAVFNTNNIGIIRLRTPVANYSNTLRAILIPGPSHANDLHINVRSFISGYGVYQLGMLSDDIVSGKK